MTDAFLIESYRSQSSAAAAEVHPGDHCCQTCSPERRLSCLFRPSRLRAAERDRSGCRRTRECLAGAVVSPLTDTRGLRGTPFSRIVEHDPVKSAPAVLLGEEEGGGPRGGPQAFWQKVCTSGRLGWVEEKRRWDSGGRRAKVRSSSGQRHWRSRGGIQMSRLKGLSGIRGASFSCGTISGRRDPRRRYITCCLSRRHSLPLFVRLSHSAVATESPRRLIDDESAQSVQPTSSSRLWSSESVRSELLPATIIIITMRREIKFQLFFIFKRSQKASSPSVTWCSWGKMLPLIFDRRFFCPCLSWIS